MNVKSLPGTVNGASQQARNRSLQESRTKGIKKYQAKRLQQLKDKTLLKKQITPNKESALTKLLKPIYNILRVDFLQHNKICRARYAGCTYKSTEVHHMYKRSGWWLIVMKFFFPICRNCHRQVTNNSKDAINSGISISRHSDVQLDFNKHTLAIMKRFNVEPPI